MCWGLSLGMLVSLGSLSSQARQSLVRIIPSMPQDYLSDGGAARTCPVTKHTRGLSHLGSDLRPHRTRTRQGNVVRAETYALYVILPYASRIFMIAASFWMMVALRMLSDEIS
jgi:hypothetical protein